MKTEAEAFQCHCPFSKCVLGSVSPAAKTVTVDLGAPSFNRVFAGNTAGSETVHGTCAGSHCMAWRWERYVTQDGTTGGDSSLGYCGLAGKP